MSKPEVSFGSQYRGDSDDERLLAYLDAVAQIPPVAEAKAGATRALELRTGDRALDVGCGTGVDLRAPAAAVGSQGAVVGLDPNASALSAARERLADLPHVSFERGHVEALPFADASFDACRMDRTLQHVADPEAALAEVRRVLRPGARLVLLDLGLGLRGVTTDLERRVREALYPDDREAWVPLMLPVLLQRAGFCDVALDTWDERSGDPADAMAALRIDDALEEAVHVGSLAPDTARAWRAEVDGAAGRGELGLRMHFIRFAARVPGGARQPISGSE